MNIQKLTITQDELNEAVQDWLKKKGISIPVESCSRQYSWGEYTVELKEPEATIAPAPVPTRDEPLMPLTVAVEQAAKTADEPVF